MFANSTGIKILETRMWAKVLLKSSLFASNLMLTYLIASCYQTAVFILLSLWHYMLILLGALDPELPTIQSKAKLERIMFVYKTL